MERKSCKVIDQFKDSIPTTYKGRIYLGVLYQHHRHLEIPKPLHFRTSYQQNGSTFRYGVPDTHCKAVNHRRLGAETAQTFYQLEHRDPQ